MICYISTFSREQSHRSEVCILLLYPVITLIAEPLGVFLFLWRGWPPCFVFCFFLPLAFWFPVISLKTYKCQKIYCGNFKNPFQSLIQLPPNQDQLKSLNWCSLKGFMRKLMASNTNHEQIHQDERPSIWTQLKHTQNIFCVYTLNWIELNWTHCFCSWIVFLLSKLITGRLFLEGMHMIQQVYSSNSVQIWIP